MSQTWWLIEIGQPSVYYCSPGEWCSNANHAKKFETPEEAHNVLAAFPVLVGGPPRVAGHIWTD